MRDWGWGKGFETDKAMEWGSGVAGEGGLNIWSKVGVMEGGIIF